MACCAIMLALIPVLFYIIILIFQFCLLNAKLLIFLVVNVEKTESLLENIFVAYTNLHNAVFITLANCQSHWYGNM